MTEQIDESHLVDLLEGLAAEIAGFDYSKECEEFLPVVAEQHLAMFSGQHDSNGHSWASLAAKTIRRKGQNRILFESGMLEASLISVGGPRNISKSSPQGFLFGTNIDYATFHQTGAFSVPAWPPLGLSEETIDVLLNRVADAMVAKLIH